MAGSIDPDADAHLDWAPERGVLDADAALAPDTSAFAADDAAGRFNNERASNPERELINRTQAALIDGFGLAATDGDTSVFVGTDSNPSLAEDPRIVRPHELEAIAQRQRETMLDETPPWARSVIAENLDRTPNSTVVHDALAELGLRVESVEIHQIVPITNEGASR